MTEQEIFDKVLNHLRQQGCQARDSTRCLYRGANGTKCAAGVLIDDEDYDASFEGQQIWSVLRSDTVILNSLGQLNEPAMAKRQNVRRKLAKALDLIAEMQQIHDRYNEMRLVVVELGDEPFVDYVNRRFRALAKRFNLVYNEP